MSPLQSHHAIPGGLNRNRRTAAGFTLVELLVAIGVIGLLAAITLPAIQASREASRLATCSSHLWQLVIANQNHVAAHGFYATSGAKAYSTVLLSFLEARMPTNEAPEAIDVYLCPSEPNSAWSNSWSVNYLPNHGSHIYLLPDGEERSDGTCAFGAEKFRPRDVIDGESQTALFSERMIAFPITVYDSLGDSPEAHRRHPLICIWNLGETYLHGQEDAYLVTCGDPARRQPRLKAYPGGQQSLGDSRVLYDHVLPPNSPACMYFTPPRPFLWSQMEWSRPATSGHPGGVQMGLCDAATRFVSEQIDAHVWRAVGTRNGGEQIGRY